MKKNRIYTISLEGDPKERIKEFLECLRPNEKIVSKVTDNRNNNLLISTVEEFNDMADNKNKNLLLEEINSGKMPDVFGRGKPKNVKEKD